jgi:two-component system sensor histidine kinase/response regulator
MSAVTPPAAVPNVLIVDDTVENLRLLAGLLAERGYEPRPVTSGAQALEVAGHSPPDLILLDITMPGMDGYEVCARLKADPILRDIPVIFLTSLTDSADKLQAFAAGGADFITKPFQVDEVLARVKVHVELRAAKLRIVGQFEQLCALEKMRDDLVRMVVHDMRGPMMVLLMNLEMLKRKTASLGPRPQEDVDMAIEAVSNLNRMANDLLDVSRLEESKMPLVRTTVDLAVVCGEVREALAMLDESRAIEVIAAAPVEASCDRNLVKRVIENLVFNAIKHTPAGSRISLVVERGAGGARFCVRDQGPGIAPEARARIFEKFSAVSGSKEQRFHSVGLGLAFCKLSIEAHGGRIGVDAGDPIGSVFWFELPA